MVAASPDQLLVADSRGCLHLFDAALLLGGSLPRLAPLARFPPPGHRYHEPACLQSLPCCGLAGGPAVLLALSSGEVVLSRLGSQVRGLRCARGFPLSMLHADPSSALVPPPLPVLLVQPWRLEAVREVRLAPASAKVNASLCPGGACGQPDLLLVGGEDCTAHVLDASSASERPRLLAALAAQAAPVFSVAWGESGRRLVAGDKSGVVVVWEAAASPHVTH